MTRLRIIPGHRMTLMQKLIPNHKHLIHYQNVYAPKRELKNNALIEVYLEKGTPPVCQKIAINAEDTKWLKGTLTHIHETYTTTSSS